MSETWVEYHAVGGAFITRSLDEAIEAADGGVVEKRTVTAGCWEVVPNLTLASELDIGTVAWVMLPGSAALRARPRPVYVAEVRRDFGPHQWFGSWNGQALEPDTGVEVINYLSADR